MFVPRISDLFVPSFFKIVVYTICKSFFLFIQPYTSAKELYIATLKDIQMWNKREMRVGLEWAKTFDLFNQLSLDDRVSSFFELSRIICIVAKVLRGNLSSFAAKRTLFNMLCNSCRLH